MSPRAHAQEIVERYRIQGWTGAALEQRIAKHARLLMPHDRAVATVLVDRVERRGVTRKFMNRLGLLECR